MLSSSVLSISLLSVFQDQCLSFNKLEKKITTMWFLIYLITVADSALVIDIVPKTVTPGSTSNLTVNCSITDNSDLDLTTTSSLVLSRLNGSIGESEELAELNFNKSGHSQVTRLSSAENSSTVDFGAGHVSVTLRNPTQAAATVYGCDLRGKNRWFAEVRLTANATVLLNVARRATPVLDSVTNGVKRTAVHVEVRPTHIKDQTDQVTAACYVELSELQNEPFYLTSLSLSHSLQVESPEFEHVAVATNIEGIVDLDNKDLTASASFIYNIRQLYMKVVWKSPEPTSRAGLYKCEAKGKGLTDDPIALSAVARVVYEVEDRFLERPEQGLLRNHLKRQQKALHNFSDRKLDILFSIVDRLASEIENSETKIDVAVKKSIAGSQFTLQNIHYQLMSLQDDMNILSENYNNISQKYDHLVKNFGSTSSFWKEETSNVLRISRNMSSLYTKLAEDFKRFVERQWPRTSHSVMLLNSRYDTLQKRFDAFEETITKKVNSIESRTTNTDNAHSIKTSQRKNVSVADKDNFIVSESFNDRRYWLTKNVVFTNISEAHGTCTRHGGYLVELDTVEEYQFIRDRLLVPARTQLDTAMTGATDEGHEGRWRNRHSGTEFRLHIWNRGEPNNQFGNEHCQSYGYTGVAWVINDRPCYNTGSYWKIGFICEIPDS